MAYKVSTLDRSRGAVSGLTFCRCGVGGVEIAVQGDKVRISSGVVEGADGYHDQALKYEREEPRTGRHPDERPWAVEQDATSTKSISMVAVVQKRLNRHRFQPVIGRNEA